MTPKKDKALVALLTYPTQKAAANAAGISDDTLRRYLRDPDFQAEYRRARDNMISEATAGAQQALSPALSVLKEIVEDKNQSTTARIQAARALLEYGLRLTEITDILRDLEDD